MRIEDLFHVGTIHRNLRFFRVACVLNNQENQIANAIVNKDQLCRVETGTKEKVRVCMCWLMGGSL